MNWRQQFDQLDAGIAGWMARYGVTALRLALGTVFLWFGVIKFVPGWSPAADLAIQTIDKLTLGILPANVSLIALAAWESLIGIGLLSGRFLRLTLLLLFLQMVLRMRRSWVEPCRRHQSHRPALRRISISSHSRK